MDNGMVLDKIGMKVRLCLCLFCMFPNSVCQKLHESYNHSLSQHLLRINFILGLGTPPTHLADIFRSPVLTRLDPAPKVFMVEGGTQIMATQVTRIPLMGLEEPYGGYLISR